MKINLKNLITIRQETVMLTLLGGLIGIELGYGGAYIVSAFAKWPPLVSWEGVVRRITLYDVRYYFVINLSEQSYFN
jgi:hypothetical protein